MRVPIGYFAAAGIGSAITTLIFAWHGSVPGVFTGALVLGVSLLLLALADFAGTE
jgi:hypothetical protein